MTRRRVARALAAALSLFASAPASAGSLAYMPIPDLPQGAVQVFDPLTRSPRFPIPAGARPCGIAMNPAGTTAYVPNCQSGAITVIDTVANAAVGTLAFGIASPCSAVDAAVDPGGRFLYVAGAPGVAVIDLAAGAIATVVPASGCALALDPAGDLLYVDNQTSVVVISTASFLTLTTVPILCPQTVLTCAVSRVVMHPSGSAVYVSHKFDGSINVIDPESRSAVASIRIAGPVATLGALAPHPTEPLLYVARGQAPAGDVAVASTQSNVVVSSLPLAGPTALATSATGDALYVATGDADRSVHVVDPATESVDGSFSALPCRLCAPPAPPVAIAFGGAAERPSLLAQVNQPVFSAGQSLSLTAGAVNTGMAADADFYAGLILPDGNSVVFLTRGGGIALGARDQPASFRPTATGVSLAAPFSVTVPGFLSHQWTGAEPRGEYAFFLLAVRAGAAPGFAGADVLGLAVAPFAFP